MLNIASPAFCQWIVITSYRSLGIHQMINSHCNILHQGVLAFGLLSLRLFKGSKACFQKKGIKLQIGAWRSVLLQSGWKESIFARTKLEKGYNEYLGTRPDNGKLSCCSTR